MPVEMECQSFVYNAPRGRLERRVAPAGGTPYVHAVSLDAVGRIVSAMHPNNPNNIEAVAAAAFGTNAGGRPRFTTRVAVVVAFMDECGLAERSGRAGFVPSTNWPDDVIGEVVGLPHRVFPSGGAA